MGYHHFSLGQEIAMTVLRGIIYEAEHHLLRGMGLGEIAVIGLGVFLLVKIMTRRRPGY